MIEEQAKERWCPFLALVISNYKDDGASNDKCIGSNCMMWTVDRTAQYIDNGNRYGYCGLTGGKL